MDNRFADYALTTDLYQLTMAQGYIRAGMAEKRAVFDLFVRSLPKGWSYLLACGLDEALSCLENFQFNGQHTNYLVKNGFSREFCDYLLDFRFRGNVRAVAEGTPIFPNEPLLEVQGNVVEAQIVETLLLSILNYQTLICTKASRIVEAADPLPITDFGLRRAPGPEAGIRASRAAYIAGAAGTSDVEAGRRYGIPISGTMAHSWVMLFPNELDAFRAWCKAYPEGTTLLIDTYDVDRGARNACQVVREGAALKAVRIDSGDFSDNAFRVRGILNDAGLEHVRIVVSGDMNEDKIRALKTMSPRPPIDAFGVGTDMVTARPESALGGVYKLVEADGRPCIKLSSGKLTWPGQKQIWRFTDSSTATHDVLSAFEENFSKQGGRPLLGTVMVDGKRIGTSLSVSAIRDYRREQTGFLPAAVILPPGKEYLVRISDGLEKLRNEALRGCSTG